jgi:hypothetical protein
MGILDFFRRNTSVPSAGVARNVESANISSVVGSEGNSRQSTELAEPSDSTEMQLSNLQRTDDAPASYPAPPAWSVLAPIGTVAQRSMPSSFDSAVATNLRSLRGPDALFVSSGLSHTVNRKASGVIDGLITPSSAAPTEFAAWQTDGEQVLRRKHPTAMELPALDVAHSRWPILARMTATNAVTQRVSPERDGTHSQAASSNPVSASVTVDREADIPMAIRRQNEMASSGFDESTNQVSGVSRISQMVNSVSEFSPPNTDTSSSTTVASPTTGLVGSSLQRSLSTVSPEIGASRLVLPKAGPVMAAFSAPVINRQTSTPASGPPAFEARQPAQSEAPGRNTVREPTILRSTLSAPAAASSAATGMVDRTADSEVNSSVGSSNPSVSEFMNLRRRSIVEMPSSSESNVSQSIASSSESNTSFLSRSSETTGQSEPTGSGASVGSAESAELALSSSEVPAARLTLGRKGGLGEPISAIPESARQAALGELSRSVDPFTGWNDASPDLALADNHQQSSAAAGSAGIELASSPEVATIARSADDSFSTSSAAISAIGPAPQESTPLLGDSYLRVVGQSGETNELPKDATPPTALTTLTTLTTLSTTTDRPLLGENSMVHRLSDGSGGESLLASSGSNNDSQEAVAAVVPVQRLVSSSGLGGSLPSGQGMGDGGLSRGADASAPGSTVRAHITETKGNDSYTNPVPRALQRVTDGNAPKSTLATPVQQSGSSFATAVSMRSASSAQRSAITSVAETGNASLAALVPVRFAPNTPVQRSFAAPQQPAENSASGNPMTTGNLALLERAVDRGLGPHGSPSLNESFSAGSTASSWAGVDGNWSTNADESPSSTWMQREGDETGDTGAAGESFASAVVAPSTSSEAPAGSTAGGASATGSSAQAETDLEMLAGRIYDRIRNRLRRELLDDRERAGLTLDRVR